MAGARVVDAIWTAATDQDFQVGTNWYERYVGFMLADEWPDSGSTLSMDDVATGFPPTSNKPAAGTFHFYAEQGNAVTDADFLDGAEVGNVTADTGGTYNASLPITGNVALGSDSPVFVLNENVEVGGTFEALSGTITASDAFVLTLTSAMTGNGFEIDWANGLLDIEGGIEGTGVSHSNAAQDNGANTLICTLTANLNLGGTDATGLAIEINTVGTVTPTAAVVCGTFALVAGTYAASAIDHTVYGNLCLTDATLGAQTGTWRMAANGTLDNDAAAQIKLSIDAGVTVTGAGSSVYVKSIAGAGNFTTAAGHLYVNQLAAAGNNKWAITGTVTVTGGAAVQYILGGAAETNATPIVVAGPLVVGGQNGFKLTAPHVSSTTLQVTGDTNARKVMLATPKLQTGAVTLGLAATTGDGGLVLTGTAAIESLGYVGTGENTVTLTNAYLQCSGAIVGETADSYLIVNTGVAHTSHIEGLGTGSIDWVDPDLAVHCHNMSDGGNNGARLDFNAYAPPGSRALCGCGV